MFSETFTVAAPPVLRIFTMFVIGIFVMMSFVAHTVAVISRCRHSYPLMSSVMIAGGNFGAVWWEPSLFFSEHDGGVLPLL